MGVRDVLLLKKEIRRTEYNVSRSSQVHPASIPVIEQLIQEPYHNQTHPVGTVMRMMERPKPFEMRALDSSGES